MATEVALPEVLLTLVQDTSAQPPAPEPETAASGPACPTLSPRAEALMTAVQVTSDLSPDTGLPRLVLCLRRCREEQKR